MIGRAYLPSLPLRAFVKSYQLWHFVFPDSANLPYKPYAPRPEHTLAFYPRGGELVEYLATNTIVRRPRSMLMGQYVERTNRHLSGPDNIVLLVNFQPGVLYRITRIPFDKLTNTFIDAEAVFSNEIRMVNERLNSTDNYGVMIEIIESFLYGIIRNIKLDTHPIDALTNILIEHPENTSVIRLAKESFLCARQFERKFKERMGVSPKLLTRIARVHKAFRMKYNFPLEDWLGIAIACGYYDYQHLAKDFQEFAGVTPVAYFLEDNNAPERLFGLRDTSL